MPEKINPKNYQVLDPQQSKKKSVNWKILSLSFVIIALIIGWLLWLSLVKWNETDKALADLQRKEDLSITRQLDFRNWKNFTQSTLNFSISYPDNSAGYPSETYSPLPYFLPFLADESIGDLELSIFVDTSIEKYLLDKYSTASSEKIFVNGLAAQKKTETCSRSEDPRSYFCYSALIHYKGKYYLLKTQYLERFKESEEKIFQNFINNFKFLN